MGFFSSLKKVFNPGGAAVSKLVNDGRDYQGLLDYGLHGSDQAKKNQDAQKVAQQSQYTPKPAFTPDPGLNPASQRLGWTNGGYNYHNSPFNVQQPPPQSVGEGPLSFGGIGRMPGRMQSMGLQPPPQGGNMQPAGAQPSVPPTSPQQLALIQSLRGR